MEVPSTAGHKVDRKGPTITVDSPPWGYVPIGQPVNVGCLDDGSGVASCLSTLPNGARIESGSGFFEVEAVDQVGNVSRDSRYYSATYEICAKSIPSAPLPVGSVLPIRVRVCEFGGVNASSSNLPASIIELDSAWYPVSDWRPFAYDDTQSEYVFDLDTTGYAPGLHRFLYLVGGTSDWFEIELLYGSSPRVVTTVAAEGPGSLRQAILDANANPDFDSIIFNIPGSGVQTIAPLSPLPEITAPVIIDGYTQPGAGANGLTNGNDSVLLIELSGANAGSGVSGIRLSGSGSTLRGLVINRFSESGVEVTGKSNYIRGNFIGTDGAGATALGNRLGVLFRDTSFSVVGGEKPADRNIISANVQAGVGIIGNTASNNTVFGNFIGTDAGGRMGLGGQAYGVWCQDAPSNTIGGLSIEARNIISGNGSGVFLIGATASGNQIIGNLIGTDVSGTVVVGNSTDGVHVEGPSNSIGVLEWYWRSQTNTGGNVICGNPVGVLISGHHAFLNQVVGNRIGTDSTGQLRLGNTIGVMISSAHQNTIGHFQWDVQWDANIIDGNGTGVIITGAGATDNVLKDARIFGNGTGVIVGAGATNNRISSNKIFGNTGLAIDLGGDGITPNDPGDADTGPNHMQNFPLITRVVVPPVYSASDRYSFVTFVLQSTPNTSFHLECFASTDSSTYPQAEIFVDARDVVTDANGNATFMFGTPIRFTPRHSITATATDPFGNTSELSPAARLGQTAGAVDLGIGDPGVNSFGTNNFAGSAVLQPDGRVVGVCRAGYTNLIVGTHMDIGVFRLTTHFGTDHYFGDDFINGPGPVRTDFGSSDDEQATGVALQPDGRIVVVGTDFRRIDASVSPSMAVLRYTFDGFLDPTFQGTGKSLISFDTPTRNVGSEASAVIVRPNGRIVVVGSIERNGPSGIAHDFVLVQLNSDGSLDTQFGTDHSGAVTTDFGNSDDVATAAILQPDGKVVVVGHTSAFGSADLAFVRYHVDGTVDTSGHFDFNGSDDFCTSVALQPDGKLVLAGHTGSDRGDRDFALLRLNPDGTLDPSFAGGRIIIDSGAGRSDEAAFVGIQSDGKIVLGGSTSLGTPETETIVLVRLFPNGTLETSFGDYQNGFAFAGYYSLKASALFLDGDGRMVTFGTYNRDPSWPEGLASGLVRWAPGAYPLRGAPLEIPGRIEVEDYDNGGPDTAYHDLSVDVNEAAGPADLGESAIRSGSNYRPASGVDLEKDSDGGNGVHVGYIEASEWLQYTVNVLLPGPFQISARVASAGRGGTFHVEMNGEDVSGPINIPDTGGNLQFQTVTATTRPLAVGTHVMRVVFDRNGANQVYAGNLNYLHFWVLTPPRLTITRSGNGVTLSWPASAAGFRLQVAQDLKDRTDWVDVAQTPILISGQMSVTLGAHRANEFYRLSAP